MASPQCASAAKGASSDGNAENVKKFTYAEICEATKQFCDFVGQGGFGTVYRAVIDGKDVAVKTLNNPMDKQFITELKTLTRFKHENVLQVIGYCIDTKPCLVLEYMVNGSLEDRLACKDNSVPLPWDVRLNIAIGTARGINHLHILEKPPMVHRDIKSANILLDRNFIPKVADFGMVRIGTIGNSSVKEVTKTRCGTDFYMAPEARRGDVSTKLDSFSFGMVLLELLTGLPSDYRDESLKRFSKTQILDNQLDGKASWDKLVAENICIIAKRCLKKNKRTRPTISDVLPVLERCVSLKDDSHGNAFKISEDDMSPDDDTNVTTDCMSWKDDDTNVTTDHMSWKDTNLNDHMSWDNAK